MTDLIRTCVTSLLQSGFCCMEGCPDPARFAALEIADDGGYTEHAVCNRHSFAPGWLGTKPLQWSATWGPPQA